MLYHPWSYRFTIDVNSISLKRICVLSYLCLLLTKVLFETSFKSCQYNTKGRRLSNYSIKLILCSHYRSRYKGLCQNKKHGFDQYTKGGHFCAAHMALTLFCLMIRVVDPSFFIPGLSFCVMSRLLLCYYGLCL